MAQDIVDLGADTPKSINIEGKSCGNYGKANPLERHQRMKPREMIVLI